MSAIPEPLHSRLQKWNTETAAAYDWHANTFFSQDAQARAAQEYVSLAEMLWAREIEVLLDMWW